MSEMKNNVEGNTRNEGSKKKIVIPIVIALLVILAALFYFLLAGRGDAPFIGKTASAASFNKEPYVKPDYDVDGVLDEKIWEKAAKFVFGDSKASGDEVTFKYYFGKRGITASFAVTDTAICYSKTARTPGEVFSQSDAVYLYLDVKNDGGFSPRSDDLKICIAADGRTAVAKGLNGRWTYSSDSLDCQVTVDGKANEQKGGETDKSWIAEIFVPYSVYGIDKDAIMGMMLEWDDSKELSKAPVRYIWFDEGTEATTSPDLFNPVDKNGLATAACEGWIPSMGRFIGEGADMVAQDVRALAYSSTMRLPGGKGTLEATIDLTRTKGFFDVSRFSGLLLSVDGVGETENPGWEVKNQYGIFVSNSETNPQLVVASIRMKDGKAAYNQLAGGSIKDVLPDFAKDKVLTVRAAKNGGWIELYIKDAKGTFRHLYDVFDIDAINGVSVGVRAAVKGFAVRDVKTSADAPAAPNPYTGSDVKVYSGLLQKLDGDEFCARTAGTRAAFGKLRNKYGTKGLKTIVTSLTLPAKPKGTENQIKGILLNYDNANNSYLVLDYSHRTEKSDGWDFYIRQRKPGAWGGTSFVMTAQFGATYDFRITPIDDAKGATAFYVEYKKRQETVWESAYCKNDGFVMSGDEFGIETGVGNQIFTAPRVTDFGYTRLDDGRYETLDGLFFGRSGGGAVPVAKQSMVIDRNIKLTGKDSYSITGSYDIVPDRTNSIKGIIFNRDAKTGSYLVLDYRYYRDAYGLFVREYAGKKWGDTKDLGVSLEENARYDFKINVICGKSTTTVAVEYKKQTDKAYRTSVCVFDVSMPGRAAGYHSTVANGIQFGPLSQGMTNYIGAEDSKYELRNGAFTETEGGRILTSKTDDSLLLDRKNVLDGSAAYGIQGSFKVISVPGTSEVEAKVNTIKGIVFNFDPKDNGHFVLDYRYDRGAYKLFIRTYSGGKWTDTWDTGVILTENTWYDFRIGVVNLSKSTMVDVDYRKGDAAYQRVSHTFGYVMPGRMTGYSGGTGVSFKPNVLLRSAEAGIPWPEDWGGALDDRKKGGSR